MSHDDDLNVYSLKSQSKVTHPSCAFSHLTLNFFFSLSTNSSCVSSFFFGFFLLALRSSVLCGHLFEGLHWFHNLVGGEGLLHLSVLVHLMDALCHCDGHLLSGHPIVLPFCLLTVQN